LDHYLPSQAINKLSHVEVANFIIYMKTCYNCEAIYSMEDFLKTRIFSHILIKAELKITEENQEIMIKNRSLTPNLKNQENPRNHRIPLKEKYKILLNKLKNRKYEEYFI